MAIADDLKALAVRVKRDFNALHDFDEHSKFAWDRLTEEVKGGFLFTLQSPVTGTIVDQTEMLHRIPEYVRKYLRAFTFRQSVAIFEHALFDFFRLVYTHNPWPFARKQLEFGTVLTAADRDEIIAGVLAKELNELKYDNVRAWFAAVDKALSLGCPTLDAIDTLAEIKAARDVLEHNDGIVNAIYLRKAGAKARLPLGEVLEVEDDYQLASWQLMQKTLDDLLTAALGKIATTP